MIEEAQMDAQSAWMAPPNYRGSYCSFIPGARERWLPNADHVVWHGVAVEDYFVPLIIRAALHQVLNSMRTIK
jgi:hypothetical protein